MNEQDVTHKLKLLARLGYGSRGVVYLMIGGLAMLAAFGNGGETTGSKGAMLKILEQPVGTTLMVIIIIGLISYVL